MNQRDFVFPILFLFFLSSCTHLSSDLDKSTDSNNLSASAQVSPEEGENQDSDAAGVPTVPTGTENGENKVENGSETDAAGALKIQTDLDEALELCQLSQEYWQQGE